MARKTNGTAAPRSKKTTESAAAQPTPSPATPEVAKVELAKPEAVKSEIVKPEAVKHDVRENVQAPVVASGKTSVNATQASLDEEIRRRAYELYLQRNGNAGDPSRDWFVAEREVRARHATAGR
jgi:hypothetical protein